MPNPPPQLENPGHSHSAWDPFSFPLNIIRSAATMYSHLVEPAYSDDILDVGAIWKAVRSGVWYPCGWGNADTASGQADDKVITRIQNTMAFVVKRLDEMEGKPATSTVSDIVLADFAGRRARTHIRHCSVPELRCLLAALQSLSSPWRKLPDELLIEVFSWCLPSNTVFSTSTVPLLLTIICSRWHALSINTPSLWTSLILTKNFLIHKEAHLRVATDFEKHWRRHDFSLGSTGSEFMSMILRRSGSLPISFSSHSAILLQDDTRNLFYKNFSRFKDLALLIPGPKSWYSAPIPNVNQPLVAPLLETLHIYALEVHGPPLQGQGSWASPYVDLIHSSAPTLRQLSLCVTSWPRVDFNQNWCKLTHITWRTGIPEGQVITLFHRSPNLVYASFPEILPGYYDSTSNAILGDGHEVMANLETLIVGTRNMEGVFTAITAPKLKHLVHSAPSNEDKQAMIAFLQRSACPLETLYLYYANYDSHMDLLDVLQNVEGGVRGVSDETQFLKQKGHLKALLITDGHHERRLLSDHLMDRLTWPPSGRRETVDLTKSGIKIVDENDPNAVCSEESHRNGIPDGVLFPGLEYLSLYDIGPSSPGKFSEMLRSRTSLTASSIKCPDSRNECSQSSTSVAKLKVFETWHRTTGLNDVSDEDWAEADMLRDEGLVFRLFKANASSGSCMSNEEKVLLRRYVGEEGLVVRDFLHDTGQFAPIALDEEIQTIDADDHAAYS
ncbi:hypothetical protein D9756_003406 [Leucocoprinus leucothites]|uniref:F-box domain-containing protein n=1 Tax=Leucocoprinus leucothites TaxID=201217 RepID=A0A8H5G6Z0_9AGAR|nr:hypothetical protein D9756_003406 [Leucoagaricus leucothites]